MGLLDSIRSAVAGKSQTSDGSDLLGAALGSLLAQNGGLQGLIGKFNAGGLGDIASSWIGLGENKPISNDQISAILGSEQVKSIAAKLGVDPAQASGFLAEYLPKIVDKLTPTGQVDPSANHADGLAALLPALLASVSGASRHA
jgi:uncharacterized protein YidB (DUF937 family)